MKFWQRQVVVSLCVVCAVFLLFLHSRSYEDSTSKLLARSRQEGHSVFLQPPAESKEGRLVERRNDVKEPSSSERRNDVKKPSSSETKEGKAVHNISAPPPPLTYVQRVAGGECPQLVRPENVAENLTFQPVDGQRALLVFSAFLDVKEHLVRIIGLSSQRGQSAFCLLWYNKGQRELAVVSAHRIQLPEGHGRKYSAVYLQCPLPDSEHPYAVSLTSPDCRKNYSDVQQPSNVLLVQKSRGLRHNFTVCVTALNYRYSRAYELVEMIELNRILGADLFTFYVHTIGDNVERVLRWYQRQGLVQLVPWELPMAVDHWPPNKEQPPEVHYFAQLASHNDCLNRHRGTSRYLVYQDLDEFIIPKVHRTWKQMLNSFQNNSSAFFFRCVFYRKDWPRNTEDYPGRAMADKFRSVVLSTDKREPNPFPHSQRAKYIVDPDGIQTVGIHNVWTYRGSRQAFYVTEKDALMHHYRNWENPGDSARAVRDTSMYGYREELLQRLTDRWAELPDVPLDIPISKYGQV